MADPACDHRDPLDRATGRCALCEVLGNAVETESAMPKDSAEASDADVEKTLTPDGVVEHGIAAAADGSETAAEGGTARPSEGGTARPSGSSGDDINPGLVVDISRGRADRRGSAGAPPSVDDDGGSGNRRTEGVSGAGGETATTNFEIFKKELEDALAAGYFPILFFGFRTAGKTWLLHRLRYELTFGEGDTIDCQPPFAPITDEEGVRDLGGTTKPEFYYFIGAKQPFVLIDINGEAIEDLVKGEFQAVRELLAAMRVAKAMIIALPSDVVIFGPAFPGAKRDAEILAWAKQNAAAPVDGDRVLNWAKDFRNDKAKLTNFTTGLFLAVGALSYMRVHNLDPLKVADFAQITLPKVRAHIADYKRRRPVGGRSGVDCPTFFALTKADRVLPLYSREPSDAVLKLRYNDVRDRFETRIFKTIGQRAGFETEPLTMSDPWLVVRRANKTLHNRLLANFPLAKFDHAAAFFGHDGSDLLTADHYEQHPQFGVAEMIEWISAARGIRRLPRLLRFHYALATRGRHYIAGIKLRRMIDFFPEGTE